MPTAELSHGKVTGAAGSRGAAPRSQALHLPPLLETQTDSDVESCKFFANPFFFFSPCSSVTKRIQCRLTEESCARALLGKGAEEARVSPVNLWAGFLICAVHQGIPFFLGTAQHLAQTWLAASSLTCNRHKIAIPGALFPTAFPGS